MAEFKEALEIFAAGLEEEIEEDGDEIWEDDEKDEDEILEDNEIEIEGEERESVTKRVQLFRMISLPVFTAWSNPFCTLGRPLHIPAGMTHWSVSYLSSL